MLIYLLSLAHGLDTDSCATIVCDSSISPYCMQYSNFIVSINSCPESSICLNLDSILSTSAPFENIKCIPAIVSNTTSSIWGAGKNPTGWNCTASTDCDSGNCANNTCVGLLEGDTCSSDGQCAANYYCRGVCTAVHENGSYCITDSECPVGSGCNNNTCAGLFSLTIGESAESGRFCMSNFTNNGACDSLLVYLDSGLSMLNTAPYQCNISARCYYAYLSNTKFYQSELCNCAGVPGDTGYCPMIAGVSGVDLTQRIVYTTSICSGIPAHSIDPDYLYQCQSIAQFDYLFYVQALQQRQYWAVFQSQVLQDCVSSPDVFNPYDYGINVSQLFLIVSSTLFLII